MMSTHRHKITIAWFFAGVVCGFVVLSILIQVFK